MIHLPFLPDSRSAYLKTLNRCFLFGALKIKCCPKSRVYFSTFTAVKPVLGVLAGLMLVGDVWAEPLKTENLTLQDCIEIALQRNQQMQISGASIAMAEAQYQQAMSAYWPRISADVNAQRADEDRTFSGKSTVNVPTQMGPVSIPFDLDVKLFDRDMLTTSVNLTYPIFTGGRRGAIVDQAEKGLAIAEIGERKTRLEVIRDVKKYYYGALFALDMEQLASDTLERFQVLEELTERLFQHGSLKVKKTDYLRTKTSTAITRSLLHEANYSRELAHEALTNAMGLDWNSKVTLAKDDQPLHLNEELQTLISSAHDFNPDIQQLKLAVQVTEDKITEARSGYFPVIGFQASAYKLWNDFDGGLVNSANREGWTIGVGLQWNLFDGFQTSGKVDYAKAQRRQLESQQILLDQAMALQVKQQFLRLRSAGKQMEDTREASGYAKENRELHVRAYQEEMVETKDVIESEIVETFTQSSQYRSRHELEMALVSLEFLIGQNIQSLNQ
ncbi:TolC family protein [Methylicorpusculum sp.]|uniref:TolC family protein n=1 Tax=Methylicorpusculum sp. TaxID=2713644 RepID=UPI0027310CF9|nr:TolC family protein [Methylicorpusculum sp.]MDP2179591.1 TolC family protein [Methylicorpusculum sp.]MDP3531611.1 TolC family protein [Methylicorpusculum sp.]MDZ4152257.1 TolC family protein [Methylicorpusculum sp.]